jgi:hypothetical protein
VVTKGLSGPRSVAPEMGEQESDLAGGFAERGFKLPIPVYFLS